MPEAFNDEREFVLAELLRRRRPPSFPARGHVRPQSQRLFRCNMIHSRFYAKPNKYLPACSCVLRLLFLNILGTSGVAFSGQLGPPMTTFEESYIRAE
jgi:hypothetical protein